jgi:N-acetylglucosaminyldiphosphoundecaprenol N-acetyl-beta-D-mannosaminyltransferase
MQKEKLNIFSVSVDRITNQELLQKMSDMLCSDAQIQNKIFTPNTEMLLAAKKDCSLASLLNSAELLIPDGTGIKIASRILNSPIPERLSGIDLAEDLLSIAAHKGCSVYLLGGQKGVAEAAAKNLKCRLPSLNICGTHHGYFDKSGKENDLVLEEIRAAAPQILFVCFGFPMQERWICDNLSSLPSVRIALGLGGSLDVYAGNVKRAPKAFIKMRAEWLFRIIREPRRIVRAAALPKFIMSVYRYKRKLKKMRNIK